MTRSVPKIIDGLRNAYGEHNTSEIAREARMLLAHIDAQAAEIEKLKADADRWSVIRAHWKQMKCTFRKSPNVVKRFVLTVDFDHQSGNDSTMIDREIDKALRAQQ